MWLWTTQALVTAAMPVELLEAQAKVLGEFLKFIAVAELLGAIGLILPAALRIYPGLTPFAAAGRWSSWSAPRARRSRSSVSPLRFSQP